MWRPPSSLLANEQCYKSESSFHEILWDWLRATKADSDPPQYSEQCKPLQRPGAWTLLRWIKYIVWGKPRSAIHQGESKSGVDILGPHYSGKLPLFLRKVPWWSWVFPVTRGTPYGTVSSLWQARSKKKLIRGLPSESSKVVVKKIGHVSMSLSTETSIFGSVLHCMHIYIYI